MKCGGFNKLVGVDSECDRIGRQIMELDSKVKGGKDAENSN